MKVLNGNNQIKPRDTKFQDFVRLLERSMRKSTFDIDKIVQKK